ncbi:hypothetical protein PT2222_100021 [Paraburkholderia tropica]
MKSKRRRRGDSGAPRNHAGDALRGLLKRIEEGLDHLLRARALSVAADVHRGDHAALAVADRRRDRNQPAFQFLIDDRPALRAHLPDDLLELVLVGDRARRVRVERRGAERGVERVVVERGQQHAAHRRAIGGQAAADREVDRHDLVRGHAQHVDDFGAVEHRRRAAFVDRGREFFHDRLGQIPERHRREVREAEVENLGREPEQPAFGLDVAERLQREQDAARARAREAGGGGDVGERLLGVRGVERPDHGESARERLHVGVARLFGRVRLLVGTVGRGAGGGSHGVVASDQGREAARG